MLVVGGDYPINRATVEMVTIHVSQEVRRRGRRASSKHLDDELTESGIDTNARLGPATRSCSPSSTDI